MQRALRIILNAEEDRTLLELSCADKVPRRTKLHSDRFTFQRSRYGMYQKLLPYLDWAQQTVRQTIRRWQLQGLGGLWEALLSREVPSWHEVDWQAMEKWLELLRRYSARKWSLKLLEERKVELGA